MKFTSTTPVLLAAASFAGLSALPQIAAAPLQARSPNPNSAVEAPSPRLGDSPNPSSPFGLISRSPAIRSGSGVRRATPHYHSQKKRDDPSAAPTTKAEAVPVGGPVGTVVNTVESVIGTASGLGLGLGLPIPDTSIVTGTINTGATTLSSALGVPQDKLNDVALSVNKVLPSGATPLGVVNGVVRGQNAPEILFKTVNSAGATVLGVVPVPDSVKETLKDTLAAAPVKPDQVKSPLPNPPTNTPLQGVTGAVQGVPANALASILEALNPLTIASSIASKTPVSNAHPPVGARGLPAPAPQVPQNTPVAPAFVPNPWELAPFDHVPTSDGFVELDQLSAAPMSPHPELPNPWDKIYSTAPATVTSRIGVVEGPIDTVKGKVENVKMLASSGAQFAPAAVPDAAKGVLQKVTNTAPASTPDLPVHPDASTAANGVATVPQAALSTVSNLRPDVPSTVTPVAQAAKNGASTVVATVKETVEDAKDNHSPPNPQYIAGVVIPLAQDGASTIAGMAKDKVTQVKDGAMNFGEGVKDKAGSAAH